MNRSRVSLVIVGTLVQLGACSSSQEPSPGARAGDSGQTDDGGNIGDDSAPNGDDGNAAVGYGAKLTSAEVVPALQNPSTGTATFMLLDDGVTLTYDVSHDVADATAVNMHLGAAGENGGVVHTLTPVSTHMTGQVTLATGEADALAAGLLYIDVQTASAQGGVVRGQIVTPGASVFVANLTGDQEVPNVATTRTAHAAFILNADKNSARYHFSTDAAATDVRVQKAIGAQVGAVVYPLSPAAQTIDGTLTLNATDADDLDQGRWYVNVVTGLFQAGELRGQIIRPGETLYTGVLAGGNEVPPVITSATGGAQFILAPTRDNLRYEAVVTGIIPTSAEIARAPVGQNATTPLYPLTLVPSGAIGTQPVTSTDAAALDATNIYMNVRTASWASGELRAQLTRR
jgi:hypothetical protein